MKKKYIYLIGLLISLSIIYANTAYNVKPEEVAIITQFGRIIGEPIWPGHHYRIPFIQTVHLFPVQEIQKYQGNTCIIKTADDRDIHVRPTISWRIADVVTFYQRVYSFEGSIGRLGRIFQSEIEKSKLPYTLAHIEDSFLHKSIHSGLLSREIGRIVTSQANPGLDQYGIQIIGLQLLVQ